MRSFWAAAVIAAGVFSLGAATPSALLRGYSAAGSEREQRIEAQFIDIPSAAGALAIVAAVGARPHAPGTAADYALALDARDRMRAWGLAAEIEPFSAEVDTPRKLVLQLAPTGELRAPHARALARGRESPFPVDFDLAERAEPSDPSTADRNIGLPFNAGSGNGDVSATLVYAARGLESDYETLGRAGIDVRGAIVLIRYGAQFRGLLAQRAQTRGVAGILFYSDPQDDGAARGPVYPNGPWRPPTSVERGWVGAGIHIPTLPISAATAQTLLGSLAGPPGPPNWAGALPVAYPLARGPALVHLVVQLDRTSTTLWNTIGTIPGLRGDQSVILGAHRDAWVFGAGDNGAGIATILEAARGLGFLIRGGWRPARTIVIAAWDGTEIGLAGSRAYIAAHQIEITRGCFAYLNADRDVTGTTFAAAAVPVLAPAILDATQAAGDPAIPAQTIYDRWRLQTPGGAPQMEPPGTGGDQESFLGGPGIAVATLRFSGPFGVDHSSYDTPRYAAQISDPDFNFHRAAAQLYGVITLRLADAETVPYAFSGYTPLFRSGITVLAKRAARAGRQFDAVSLHRALDRFGLAAAAFDRAPESGAGTRDERELRAVRELDLLSYGAAGSAVPFPGAAAALAANDAARTAAEIARSVAALDRAAGALAR